MRFRIVVPIMLASVALAAAGPPYGGAITQTARDGRSLFVACEFQEAARTFGAAALAAGVRRIVYLGGLGDEGEALSEHLRSRHETGDVLRASGVPVVEFRASIIIGSGSLSFELYQGPVPIRSRALTAG